MEGERPPGDRLMDGALCRQVHVYSAHHHQEQDQANGKNTHDFLGFLTISCIIAWVIRPERPKGAKDKVKQA